MSNKEATDRYKKTGKHLGIFRSVDAANKAGDRIHRQQEALMKSSTKKATKPKGR